MSSILEGAAFVATLEAQNKLLIETMKNIAVMTTDTDVIEEIDALLKKLGVQP